MQVKELKTSVADGLLAFYDEDIAEDSNIDYEEQPKNNIQKAPRTKKAANN